MELVEKFAALRLGNLQFGCAFGQRTVNIETMELQIANCGLRDFGEADGSHSGLRDCPFRSVSTTVKSMLIELTLKIRPTK